jgi:hypothetical protein
VRPNSHGPDGPRRKQEANLPHLLVAERVGESLSRLAALDDASFERLAVAVENTPPALRSPHRLYHLVADASGLPFDEVSEALFGVMSIASGLTRDGLAAQELAESIVADGIDSDRPRFDTRFARLFQSDLVQVTVRAAEIAIADQRALLQSRIVTDVRPIFPALASDNGEFRPRAALITHSLQLEYQEDGESRTFVVSIDRLDVERLLLALNRAEEKATSLVELISRMGIPYVDIDEDRDDEDEGA